MNNAHRSSLWHRLLFAGLAVGASACGTSADAIFCDAPGCDLSDLEWSRLRSLANPPLPAVDPSNGVLANSDAQRLANAERLGKDFFFDPRFSGPATLVDALGRPTAPSRAATAGGVTNVSCATCHDLARMGIDDSSVPSHVSAGAGWTDVNALAVVNSAYQRLFFTNGRADSLWALAAAVAESRTTMNGDRLQTLWTIADNYRAKYEAIFGPLPVDGSSCAVAPLLDPSGSGQCVSDPPNRCPSPCVLRASKTGQMGCWPRFPLHGKPGKTPGCQPGLSTEPFGDAFDCMNDSDPVPDQQDTTQVLVNWAKTLAAYQTLLVSRTSPFDQFVKDAGGASLTPEALRGARLFVGKASCFDCHNTPMLSDGAFHNVGVPQVGSFVPTEADCPAGSSTCDCTSGVNCLPWGALDGLTRLQKSPWLRTSRWSDGGPKTAEAVTGFVPDPALKGAWRTPSLRNVALTAPYMHDGLYATLEEVVWHYNRGGAASGVSGVSALRPLGLTEDEQADLVAFLRSLTGPPIVADMISQPALAKGECP